MFVSFLWELGYRAWGPLLTIPFALLQGYIFMRTRSLAYVVTVHLLFDAVVFLVLVHAHNPGLLEGLLPCLDVGTPARPGAAQGEADSLKADPRSDPRTTDQYPVSDKTGQEAQSCRGSSSSSPGVLEAVWATALGKSEGFTRLWPSVVFGVSLVAEHGRPWPGHMRDISTGTAYAVWVGIGAALTVAYADDHRRRALLDRQAAPHPGARRLRRRAQAGQSASGVKSHLQHDVEMTLR